MTPAKITQVLAAHRAWLDRGRTGEGRADLRGADLRGADLRDANLRRAVLRGADLRGANLSRANLSRANLSDANLRGADLRGADLRGADLRGADLSSADLSSADLSSANLSSADLSETCLDPAATAPTITEEQIAAAGLRLALIGGEEWLVGTRSRRSLHVGSTDYSAPGEYVAPWLSVDGTTECHPGIYLGGEDGTATEDRVRARTRRAGAVYVSPAKGIRCRVLVRDTDAA